MATAIATTYSTINDDTLSTIATTYTGSAANAQAILNLNPNLLGWTDDTQSTAAMVSSLSGPLTQDLVPGQNVNIPAIGTATAIAPTTTITPVVVPGLPTAASASGATSWFYYAAFAGAGIIILGLILKMAQKGKK